MESGYALWASVMDTPAMMDILMIVWRIVLVILGINALIIVHEWGHFIVARLCGVRCDKFYIWFDAWGWKFFSFRWGQTEYGLGWLPLGGYVKMLGQEDNPGGIRAELERARQGVDDQGKPLEQPIDSSRLAELETAAYAPDSYLSKNVPQRMAIISAGVVMNVIFAILCATGAALMGIPQTTSQIGPVFPATPAWINDLRPGDRILEMNGKPTSQFAEIQMAMMDGKPVKMKISRSGAPAPIEITIVPELKKGGMTPTIGISTAASLDLAKLKFPFCPSLDPAEQKEREKLFGKLPYGARLFAMNGEQVKSPSDYERLSRQFLGEPVEFQFSTIKKKEKDKSDNSLVSITLPSSKMKSPGVRLEMGEITAVQANSAAAKAGILSQLRDEEGKIVRNGDKIISINNEPIIDPLTLPYELFKTFSSKDPADSSATVSLVLTVLRNGEQLDIPLTVPRSASYSGILSNDGSVASGHLGLSWKVRPVVSGVLPTVNWNEKESPLGCRLTGLEFKLPIPAKDASDEVKLLFQTLTAHAQKTKSNTFLFTTKEKELSNNDDGMLRWLSNYINRFPTGTPLTLHLTSPSGEPRLLETKVSELDNAFLLDRGIYFGPDLSPYRAKSFKEALYWGYHKTLDMMGLVFKFLRNVGSTISPKALGGPIMIIGSAYQTTSTGDGLFLLFLCIIGANLAVVNFLPIPVLDGGHMVFLLYEAIFRRPPNEAVQIILSYIGLFLILALMFWVIFLDLQRYIFG